MRTSILKLKSFSEQVYPFILLIVGYAKNLANVGISAT